MVAIRKTFTAKVNTEPESPPGTFTALVSVFGNEDHHGDIIEPGAFSGTLKEWADRGRPIPIVWAHQTEDPDNFIGHYSEAVETEDGLQVTGHLDLEHAKAARIHKLMTDGLITEFSFSGLIREYELIEDEDDEDDWFFFPGIKILNVDLWEAGPCFKGANPATELISVKTADLEGPLGDRIRAQQSRAGERSDVREPNLPAVSKVSPNVRALLDLLSIKSHRKDTQMPPEKRLEELAKEAAALREKANGPEFTEADAERATAIAKEHGEITAMIAKQKEIAAALANVSAPVTDNRDDMPGEDTGLGLIGPSGLRTTSKGQVPAVETTVFTDNVSKAMKAAAPLIGGPAAGKALIPNGAVNARFDQTIVVDPKNSFSLYGAVSHASAGGANSGSYLRQTERKNEAGTVVTGDLKPISAYGLEQESWCLAQIAHLSPPLQRQWFEDYENLQTFISTEMAYGIDEAIADFILKGGKDEDGGTVTGILNTTGIGQTAYASSPLRTVRKAITEMQVTGARPTQIVLHPVMWEEIESSMTTEGAYILDGAPQNAVSPQLFGLPVLLSTGLPEGQAIVGDLSSVVVFDTGNIQFTWSEGGQLNTGTAEEPEYVELFRANKLVWRAEIRLGLSITSTKLLRVASLTEDEEEPDTSEE